jgi:N-methylhydantoinase A
LRTLARVFGVTPEELAMGVHAVANANMAQAIREITVRLGIDPRECALIAFGGAGPQHVAGVAEHLGIRDVVIPAHGGVLSAVGLLTADLSVTSTQTLLVPLDLLDEDDLERAFVRLELDAASRLGVASDDSFSTRRFAGVRYIGQSHEVAIRLAQDAGDVADLFEAEHERLFGTRLEDPIEVVNVFAEVTSEAAIPQVTSAQTIAREHREPSRERELRLVGSVVPVHSRQSLHSNLRGPCLIDEPNSVIVVPEQASVTIVDEHVVISLQQ